MLKAKLGLKDEVFFSVPCVIGRNGILAVLTQTLSPEESKKLVDSARTLNEVQKDIKF